MQGELRAAVGNVALVLAIAGCASGSSSASPPAPASAAAVAPSSAAAPVVTPATLAPATRPEQLRVAWTATGAGYLPFHAAIERGLFEQRGLVVEPVLTTAAQAVTALLVHELDVAHT